MGSIADTLDRVIERVTPTRNTVKRTRSWLRDQYTESLDGIALIRGGRGSVVRVKLEDPLDLDLMAQIVDDHGYPRDKIEWDKEPDGHRTMSYYHTVADDDGDPFIKSLEGTFHEKRVIRLDNPVHANGDIGDGRLPILVDYLWRRYTDADDTS